MEEKSDGNRFGNGRSVISVRDIRMAILYDSKTRRVQPWIPIAFLLIPVIVLVIGYFVTRDKVQQYKTDQEQKQQEDVFKRF